jgi:hypothetical protein
VYLLGRQFGDRSATSGRGLLGFATRVSTTRNRRRARTEQPGGLAPPPATGGPRAPRAEPTLRWKNPDRAPGGDFAPCAITNAALTPGAIPQRREMWDAVSAFSLSYDGYAYWNDLPELAARSVSGWTRNHTLPSSIDEIRGCLFYEQRRWHHFGEDPHGRSAEYVWALLDALRGLVPSVAVRPVPAASCAPVHPPRRDTATVRSFLDDDAGYLAWTADHEGGFVVNADRTLSPNSLRLHRATCPSVVGAVASGRTRTANYRKVCAADLDVIVDWCRTDIGVEPPRCRHCRP